MILVTVGTQLPFNRLVKAVDEIAPELAESVFAQIGGGTYIPKNMDWSRHIQPLDFDVKFQSASVIVAHAGIGVVLTARRFDKRIILFPRRLEFKEHRNDHQIASAKRLSGRHNVVIAWDEEQLRRRIKEPAESLMIADHDDQPLGDLIGYLRNLFAR